jgi:superfamily II DNA or RNA helicase
MVTLTIGNSVCKIEGLDRDTFVKLRGKVAVTQKTGRKIRTKSGKFIPQTKTYYLMDKKGGFPTGLLYIVEAFIADTRLKVTRKDTRKRPTINSAGVETLFVTRPFAPYPEQRDAALAALWQERGIIVGPTGVGKSAIIAEICDAFRLPALIVVPSLELKAQTTTGLREVFGYDRVGPLHNGQPERLITVENVDALDPKCEMKGIDVVIIDEFHHSGAKTYRVLNRKAWSGVYYKLGLTATPFRSRDDERLLLESVLSQVIYRIEYTTAVAKGYIVPLEAYYVDLPEIDLKCSGKNWQGVYKELVVNRADRNAIIAKIASNLYYAGKSTLVLTKEIKHGEKLCDLISLVGPMPEFVKGENDDNRSVIKRFSRGDDPLLVGTSGIIGEGVDTKAAEYVVLAGGGKSKNAFMQQCGRVFRRFGEKETGKVILFRDPSHKWLLAHFNAQVKYLADEYGIKPSKLDL